VQVQQREDGKADSAGKGVKTRSIPERSGASPGDSSPAPSQPRAARGSPPLCPPPGVALVSNVSTTTVRVRSTSLHGFMPLMKLSYARHLWRSVKNVTVIVICNAEQRRHADRETQSTCSPPVAGCRMYCNPGGATFHTQSQHKDTGTVTAALLQDGTWCPIENTAALCCRTLSCQWHTWPRPCSRMAF